MCDIGWAMDGGGRLWRVSWRRIVKEQRGKSAGPMATDAFGGWLKERDEDTKGFAYRTPDSWGLIKHFSSEGRFIVLKIDDRGCN